MSDIKIQKISPSKYSGVVFNLEVENDHSYLTEFLTVHNCRPNASKDIYIDRESVEKQNVREPIRTIAGFKIYRNYTPSHRYAGGMDVAGGVGLDSSASVFIDFDTIPAQVVGTFHSNTIQPEAFGDEIYNEANYFGGCMVAPENNKYDQAVLKAKLLGADLFSMPNKEILIAGSLPKSYGWSTNSLTKSKMLSSIKQAIEDGLIELNDADLIAEAKNYSRNDLIDKEEDPRLSTRHFDLFTACAIAWQMKDYAVHRLSPNEVRQKMNEKFSVNKSNFESNSNK
jgi:hypothetical protein